MWFDLHHSPLRLPDSLSAPAFVLYASNENMLTADPPFNSPSRFPFSFAKIKARDMADQQVFTLVT